jgi:hypothetical protein
MPHRTGYHRVQDPELREAFRRTERYPKNLWTEAASAHPQQDHVSKSGLLHGLSECPERCGACLHVVSDRQPAQSVDNFGGIRLPDGMVLFPNTIENMMTIQLLKRSDHRRLVRAQLRDEDILQHATRLGCLCDGGRCAVCEEAILGRRWGKRNALEPRRTIRRPAQKPPYAGRALVSMSWLTSSSFGR